MIKQNGIVTLGLERCINCDASGQSAKRVSCDTCRGTGRGQRGGIGGCHRCSGMRTVWSRIEKQTCQACAGTGQTAENTCSTMPNAWWAEFDFRVYRQDRGISYNESLLGRGCVYSCVDYGRAYDAPDDTAVLASVRAHTFIQLTKVAHAGRLCDHIGIFVNRGGYSVRACYLPDGQDAAAMIALERGKAEGFAVGERLAQAGSNGTLGAIYR